MVRHAAPISLALIHDHSQAVWNDHGPNASTILEAFYAFKEGLPVIAAANWQAASRPNHLTHAQFLEAYHKLEAAAPGQNLDRRIASKGPVVAAYQLPNLKSASVRDSSGNGYDARLLNGVLYTPLGSKGHNYTLKVVTSASETAGTLLVGPDSSFGLTTFGSGRTLAFVSDNITYPLFNYTLPTNTASTIDIILAGTEIRTSAWVNGAYAGDFVIGIDGTQVFEPMAFVAPVQQIGGVGLGIQKFTLWDGLQEISQITNCE